MKKQRSNKLNVQDMIASIEKVFAYIEQVDDLRAFLNDPLIIDAVTRNFEIIGEAAHRIDQTIKDKHHEIPWRQMYGLRNFAIHEYHIIDPVILWEIAENNLIDNRQQLIELLEKEFDE